jgi:hypothetical protein
MRLSFYWAYECKCSTVLTHWKTTRRPHKIRNCQWSHD